MNKKAIILTIITPFAIMLVASNGILTAVFLSFLAAFGIAAAVFAVYSLFNGLFPDREMEIRKSEEDLKSVCDSLGMTVEEYWDPHQGNPTLQISSELSGPGQAGSKTFNETMKEDGK